MGLESLMCCIVGVEKGWVGARTNRIALQALNNHMPVRHTHHVLHLCITHKVSKGSFKCLCDRRCRRHSLCQHTNKCCCLVAHCPCCAHLAT